ncbi:hypothetical protein GF356_09670 [candidate division GN15 bacterium]|nr:hypothetical protein [candidate division GN15 bacterium]
MTRSGYRFEKTTYGFRLTEWGELSAGEARDLRDDVLRQLANCEEPFCILVDVRGAAPPTEKEMQVYGPMFKGMLEMGCRRFALIAKSPVVRAMAERICAIPDSGRIARIFDTWNDPDAETKALAWLEHATDPIPAGTQPSPSR